MFRIASGAGSASCARSCPGDSRRDGVGAGRYGRTSPCTPSTGTEPSPHPAEQRIKGCSTTGKPTRSFATEHVSLDSV